MKEAPPVPHGMSINFRHFSTIYSSVVDPNTLILDPDPGFWPNLVPDPDPGPDPDLGYKISFERTKITNKL